MLLGLGLVLLVRPHLLTHASVAAALVTVALAVTGLAAWFTERQSGPGLPPVPD
jgi:hypothetical protein